VGTGKAGFSILKVLGKGIIPVIGLLISGVGQAGSEPEPVGESLSLLSRLSHAAHDQSYRGTYVVQRGSEMESSKILHARIHGEELTRIEVLDGRPREITRDGKETRCYYPVQHKIRIEKGYTRHLFPALIEVPYEQYLRYYDVSQVGMNRVAGRECRRILLRARDRQRFDHEFCADVDTDLILKAVTYDQHHEPLETLLFTEVSEDDPMSAELLKPTYPDSIQWKKVFFPPPVADHLSYQWDIQALPPGFSKILQMSIQSTAVPGAPFEHLVFSDGLSSFSVFIRPLQGEGFRPVQARIQSSALSYYSGTVGQHRIVVVGEVPQEVVTAIGQSMTITEETH
jgi:sigma-E factor negative regulatory protein RseB